jgi:uncharacterized membrane protein
VLLGPILIAGEPASPRLLFAVLAGCSTTLEPGLVYRAVSRGRALICIAAALSVGVTLTLLHAAGRLNAYWATAAQHVGTGGSAPPRTDA